MNIRPCDDNLIVEIIEPENKINGIIIPGSAIEESTLAVVIHPNTKGYNRDGSPRPPMFYGGEVVRIPKGNIGTGVPEAPDGKTWKAIPEDSVYYVIEE